MVRRYFKDGKLDGPWKGYYENGQLRSEGNHKSNKKVGLWKEYYENDQLRSEGNFKGKSWKDGPWKEYYENGQLWKEGNYKLHGKVGLWKEYYENGQLWKEGNFKGQEDGLWKEYFKDGTLKSERDYFPSVSPSELPSREWYLNGQLKSQFTNFKLKSELNVITKIGTPKGTWNIYYKKYIKEILNEQSIKKIWYKNGQLRREEINNYNYKEFSIWYKNGNKMVEGSYFVYGQEKEGLWKSWYYNGQIKEIGKYLVGWKTGEWNKYNENGELLNSIIYSIEDSKKKKWGNNHPFSIHNDPLEGPF